jgi:hypothetical protein
VPRYSAVFGFIVTVLPLGGCGNNDVVALPWADAKVESLELIAKVKDQP